MNSKVPHPADHHQGVVMDDNSLLDDAYAVTFLLLSLRSGFLYISCVLEGAHRWETPSPLAGALIPPQLTSPTCPHDDEHPSAPHALAVEFIRELLRVLGLCQVSAKMST
eukprot:1594441-Amphidinium_carterae.1